MVGYRVVVSGTQSIDRGFEDIASAMRFSSEVLREACRDRNERIWVDVFAPGAHPMNQYHVENGLIVGVM